MSVHSMDERALEHVCGLQPDWRGEGVQPQRMVLLSEVNLLELGRVCLTLEASARARA